jgi:Cellulose biosynthesis protein BcsS
MPSFLPDFVLKTLLAGGLYTYYSGGLHDNVDVTLASAAVLPGWRASSEGLALDVYIGPVVQDYRPKPYDPGSLLRGIYAGAQLSADAWYEPNRVSMIALEGSIASIALIGSARAAIGWRPFETFYLGPEAQAFWCLDYQQWRAGAHITGLPLGDFDWSASAGWEIGSDKRSGPYLRLGVNARY